MATDFASLRQEGLALIQRLTPERWTDHNEHDPGITILEQVCYALTDLAYRAEYALPDLLARDGEDPYASLYAPQAILPSAPVTIDDLRKLVIDVTGVKNAWVDIVDEVAASYDAARKEVSFVAVTTGQPAPGPSPNVSEIRPRGLYRVRIEKSDLADIDGSVIRRQAARRLHRFRGLGEDFAAIDVLDYQQVQIFATLEIGPVSDATALLANVYAALAEYCSPSVRFHTFAKMLERGYRVDEIFEGPLLDHGFIDPAELAATGRRDSLRLSDLIHVLGAVPGVSAVKYARFAGLDGKPSNDWLLTLEARRAPRFDLQHSSIRLERRGLRVDSEALREAAYGLFVKQAIENPAVARLGAPVQAEWRPARGVDRKVAQYVSIQRQFPMVYGIGPAGLSRDASRERQAQAKQLQAYLMFFDQLLANAFAQLSRVGTLFSFYDDTADSYFSQPVEDDSEDALGLNEIRNAGPAHAATLQRITENPWEKTAAGERPGATRRNRLLDHLLARIGEQLTDYSLVQSGDSTRPRSAAGGGQVKSAEQPAQVKSAEQLAQDKRAFLRDYPRIGRDRGVGFNYLAPPAERSSDFLPGDCVDTAALVRRLTASSPDPLAAHLWSLAHPDERSVMNDAKRERKEVKAALFSLFNRVIRGGTSLYNEHRFAGVMLSAATKQWLEKDPAVTGADLARLNRLLLEDAYPAAIARSPDAANISGLELRLRRKLGIPDDEERFHLVEHILLRPVPGDVHQTGPLFRGAQLRDPYSLQITLVFPNWPPRYQSATFIQFVEETVRDQTPAHLTAYVLWLDEPGMCAFETAYTTWIHRWRNRRLIDFGF